jgi:hypothetical protein
VPLLQRGAHLGHLRLVVPLRERDLSRYARSRLHAAFPHPPRPRSRFNGLVRSHHAFIEEVALHLIGVMEAGKCLYEAPDSSARPVRDDRRPGSAAHLGVSSTAMLRPVSGTITPSGIINICLFEFLKQLTTFRTEGPTPAERTSTLTRFGKLFLGHL